MGRGDKYPIHINFLKEAVQTASFAFSLLHILVDSSLETVRFASYDETCEATIFYLDP